MSLKIRRGTNVERLTITPAEGELIYTTDTKNLYIGDGTTAGGKFVTGLGYTGSRGEGYTGSAGIGYTGSNGSVGYTGSATGIPTGGDGGQVLSKNSNDDYDVRWVDISSGIVNSGVENRLAYYPSTGPEVNDLQEVQWNSNTSSLEINGSINASAGYIGSFSGSFTTNNLIITDNDIRVTENLIPLNIINDNSNILNLYSSIDGQIQNAGKFAFNVQKGTYSNPSETVASDYLHNLQFGAYSSAPNGSDYNSVVSLLTLWDSNSDFTSTSPAASLAILTGNNGSYNQYVFNGKGTFSASTIKTGSYNGSGSYPSSPDAGMIIFDSSDNHFYGYNGNTWKQLDN